jgi:hypothetical protein
MVNKAKNYDKLRGDYHLITQKEKVGQKLYSQKPS